MTSAPLEPEAYDCVAIVTAHSTIDYGEVVERARRSSSTSATPPGVTRTKGKVWKL